MSENYQPGVCNINQPEIAYRRKAGHIMSGVSLVVILALIVAGANFVVTLIICFIPIFLAAISYLQAKNKFCVAYAAQGVYNPDDEYAKTQKITNDDQLATDKAKANKMYLQAAGIAFLISSAVASLTTIL